MIYFDNGATGGFKPYSVLTDAYTVMQYLSANPTRSGHRLAMRGAKLVSECRKITADFFNLSSDRVIFTKNCTEALNMAIFGTLKKGGHVITTVFEHNSVLRPLYSLKEKNLIELDIVSPDDKGDIVEVINDKIKENTYLIAVTSVSNVTGKSMPIKEIGEIAKSKSITFLVDGAQGGGHINLDMKYNNISLLALAGHKGLSGIMGSGLLLIDDNTEVSPLTYGGTGTESFNLNQPDCYPEKLEAGTLNLPAIVALSDGIKYVSSNMDNFSKILLNATKYLIKNLSVIPQIQIYSQPNSSGIVSFSIGNTDSNEIADILSSEFDIAVRGGFHCAPLTHKYLCTDTNGLVRVSLAVQNTTREINFFISAINKIVNNLNFPKSSLTGQ